MDQCVMTETQGLEILGGIRAAVGEMDDVMLVDPATGGAARAVFIAENALILVLERQFMQDIGRRSLASGSAVPGRRFLQLPSLGTQRFADRVASVQKILKRTIDRLI